MRMGKGCHGISIILYLYDQLNQKLEFISAMNR